MDSKSLAGVYRFVVTPGQDTVVDVQSRLYLRKNVEDAGHRAVDQHVLLRREPAATRRLPPEVHDSDGLMVETGTGEWLWRPLSNPKRILTTSFAMPSVKGFGLMQRDRAYTSYEDDEARYELRPSAWITPVGDWGPGRVELVQLNTVDETNDNIVAYWVPAKLPAPGEPLDLAYRMRWQGNEQQHPPGAWVTQSRSGRSFATLGKGEEQVHRRLRRALACRRCLQTRPSRRWSPAWPTSTSSPPTSTATRPTARGASRSDSSNATPTSPSSCAPFFSMATTS